MSERKTDDATLIEAVRILARTITTDDGVIPACLAEAANRLETLVEERRWVPVGERLPEYAEKVLWLWSYGGSFVFPFDGIPPERATHWQPLPPGPEANGKTDLPTD